MPTSSSELPHRRSYADDPRLCDRVFDLLDTWLPVLRTERHRAERLRSRWEDCSTPFVKERDGAVIAHVGVLETDVVCMGVSRRVGGIHAVCTLESERRKGLYRVLMEEVLAHCEDRYETLKLCTQNPQFYEPFGFRVVPEHRFRTVVDTRPGSGGFRGLDLRDPDDLDLLDRTLSERAPVSEVLASANDAHVFKFNMAGEPLLYSEELALVAAMSLEDGVLTIDDLLAPTVPRLDDLLAQIESRVSEVVFHFCPDRLGCEATPEAYRYEGDVLMVRGPFPFDDRPLPERMLAPSARH